MTGAKCVDIDGIRIRYFKKGSDPLVVYFIMVILVLTMLRIAPRTGA